MQIENVEIQGDGYLINGLHHTKGGSGSALDVALRAWLSENEPTPQGAPIKRPQQVRDEALEALVHDFGDGRVMQTRPKDESNIRNAIEVMGANGIASIGWVMEDDVKQPVTVVELQDALAAGQLAAMAVWDAYDPEA